jgi:hypothetical protein
VTVPRFRIAQRETKEHRLFVNRKSIISDVQDATYNPFGRFDLSNGGGTAHVLRYQWKRNINDETALLTKTSATPGEIDFETQTPLPWSESSTLGEALVKFVPTDTDPDVDELMVVGVVYWDLWLLLDGGDQIQLQEPTPLDLRAGIGP